MLTHSLKHMEAIFSHSIKINISVLFLLLGIKLQNGYTGRIRLIFSIHKVKVNITSYKVPV